MASFTLPDGPFLPSEVDISRRALRRLEAAGAIVRLANGVYADAALSLTPALRARAVQLVAPTHAVVSRRTAGWLYGVGDPHVGWVQNPGLDLAVVEGAAAIRRAGVSGRVEQLFADDVSEVEGVRATTPLRTATDLLRWEPRYDAIGWADAFLRSKLVSRSQLQAEEDRWFGYRGVRQLRELNRFADPRAESFRESWLRLLLHDLGFPPTIPQWPVPRRFGEEPFRLDLATPELMVAYEYDGARDHGPAQQAYDDSRRRYVRSEGWTLIVVRRGDIERPQRLANAVGMFVAPIRRPRPELGIRAWAANSA